MKVAKNLKKCISILVCGMMLTACSNAEGSSASPTSTPITDEEAITATIKIRTSKDYGDWLKDTLNEFEELHTKWDLTFDIEVVEEDALLSSGETATDVYIYSNDILDDLAYTGKIAELGGETLSTTKAENAQTVMNSLMYDNQMYATPLEVDTWFVYYDTSVFEEDDLKNLDSMLKKGKVGIPLTDGEYLASFYLANGCTIYGENGDNQQVGVNFSGESAQKVTEYLVSLVKNKNFVNINNDMIAKLTEGEVNAVFASSEDYKEIADVFGENTGVMEVPSYRLSGQDKQLKAFVSSVVASVNPSSENLKVAVAIVGYLSSQHAQLSLYETNGTIPSNLSIEEEDIYINALKNTLDHASFAKPIFSETDTVLQAASTMGSELILSTVTKDNASEKTESMNASMNIAQQTE